MGDRLNPIPEFDLNGNLPPGEFVVTLEDIKKQLAWSPRRKKLLKGLEKALENLSAAGVKRVYIDGSFTTNKDDPNDVDGCWVHNKYINVDTLDPVFLDTDPPREAMKKKYGVDFLIEGKDKRLSDSQPIVEFFQESRDFDHKGILVLDL